MSKFGVIFQPPFAEDIYMYIYVLYLYIIFIYIERERLKNKHMHIFKDLSYHPSYLYTILHTHNVHTQTLNVWYNYAHSG